MNTNKTLITVSRRFFIRRLDNKERFDPPELLQEKVKILASLGSESRYIIGFTGAGISTAAGIPDYRSGKDTILETGPGKYSTDQTSEMTAD